MLPLDSATLVASFDLTPQLGPLKVERRAAPALNEFGEFVSPAPTILRVSPWVAHTAGGRALAQVPEADRSKETIEIYVQNFRLYVADNNRQPDVVHYDDRRWRVVVANRFAAQGRVHFALAVLLDTQDEQA